MSTTALPWSTLVFSGWQLFNFCNFFFWILRLITALFLFHIWAWFFSSLSSVKLEDLGKPKIFYKLSFFIVLNVGANKWLLHERLFWIDRFHSYLIVLTCLKGGKILNGHRRQKRFVCMEYIYGITNINIILTFIFLPYPQWQREAYNCIMTQLFFTLKEV